jgi:hypothetical protein
MSADLIKEIIQGGTRIAINCRNNIIIRAIKATADVANEFIIINGLAHGSKLRTETLHLCKVCRSRELKFFCAVESITEMVDLGTRGSREHGVDLKPDLSRGFEANSVRKDIRGQRVQEIAHDRLISSDPDSICRACSLDLLFVSIFFFYELWRGDVSTLKEGQNLSATQSRKDKRFPEQKIALCQLLRRR